MMLSDVKYSNNSTVVKSQAGTWQEAEVPPFFKASD